MSVKCSGVAVEWRLLHCNMDTSHCFPADQVAGHVLRQSIPALLRVPVESLGHQLLGQLAGLPGRLLQLGPLVLEPDLDLVGLQAQVLGHARTPSLSQVPVAPEFTLQLTELFLAKGRARPLLQRRGQLALARRGAVVVSLWPSLSGP